MAVIEPNFLFTHWTCYQVAECVEGVTDDLYYALWKKGVRESEKLFNENRPISDVWHIFTDEEKNKLNKIAKEME